MVVEDGGDKVSEKQRLFVDIDGTLAVFKPVDQLETLYEKGYFEKLQPMHTVLEAVKHIIWERPEIEVYILSAYLSDSPHALNEKNAWLDQYLPEMPKGNRIFMPCGTDKKDYIPQGIRNNDFLLDDYTHNLQLWQPPARGIKLLNGINHTKGTWQHDCIWYDKSPQELAANLVRVMQGQPMRDRKPERISSRSDKPDLQRMSLHELQERAQMEKERNTMDSKQKNKNRSSLDHQR